MSTVAEPSREALANPVRRYVAATRPAFLGVTLVGCLLGLASARRDGVPIVGLSAWFTIVAAVLAHAGANVLNDYFDARSGCDAANSERLYPFTGGSRLIQNGVLTLAATRRFGYLLLAAVVAAGLWLTLRSASGLLWIGAAGLFIGWAYSTPPLQLAGRALGEVAVSAAWLLVVVGSDYVQRRAFALLPVAAGLGFALLLANLLFINQFPDVRADASAGKRTLVVRLGPQRARWLYGALAAGCAAWEAGCVARGVLPPMALAALLPLCLSAAAANMLWRHAAQPSRLEPAIRLTILAVIAHGLMLCVALLFG